MISTYGNIQWNDSQKPGWFSVKLDDDLSLYYRSFSSVKWNLPMNGCHVTFISGEHEIKIISPDALESFLRDIRIDFDPVVMTNGESFWIDCQSSDLDRIRVILELGERFRGKYHITLGNLKNFR